MNFKKTLLAAAVMLAGTASQAVTINSSNPYAFSWNYSSAAGALTGTGSMTFAGWSTQDLTVNVTLTNTAALSSNRLTAFGFGVNPDVNSVTFADAADSSGMVGASLSAIPSLAQIEVCAFGGRNCAGGANGGIYGGNNSDSFVLTLHRNNFWGSSIDVAPIGFKYQTGSGSFEFTTAVPEPETYAMLLAGLGLMGTIVRRRKQSV